MKILVTGGCGFIGSNFIRYILNKYSDYKIINIDKLTYSGNLENLKDIEENPNYQFIKGDICSKQLIESILSNTQGIDAIINFAAATHVDRSIEDSTDFFLTNAYGVQALLDAIKKHKISLLIHISSDEVYGSTDKGSFSEDSPLNPSNPYSASKASADLLCKAYYKTYNLPIIIVRPSNNFGSWQYPEKIIPLFVTNAIEDKSLPVYGDGLHRREWLYVLDNCKALDLVLHNGEIGQIYNIGSNFETTNLELTKRILDLLNKPETLIKFVKERPAHDSRYFLNSDKIKKLGWRPQADFEQALRETINWYKNNQHWWQPLKEKDPIYTF